MKYATIAATAALLGLAAGVGATLIAKMDRVPQLRDPEISLRGVEFLRVFVGADHMGGHLEGQSLDEISLRSRVEKRLSDNGVRVVGREEWRTLKGGPALTVVLNSVDQKVTQSTAWRLDVYVTQHVRTVASPEHVQVARTWKAASAIGHSGFSNASDIGPAVDAKIDEFSVAWRKANMK